MLDAAYARRDFDVTYCDPEEVIGVTDHHTAPDFPTMSRNDGHQSHLETMSGRLRGALYNKAPWSPESGVQALQLVPFPGENDACHSEPESALGGWRLKNLPSPVGEILQPTASE